jgi:tRNA G10  N-methylase Trm11
MIVHADARAIPLADESVQCVVTSPPYWGLRAVSIDLAYHELAKERTRELQPQLPMA